MFYYDVGMRGCVSFVYNWIEILNNSFFVNTSLVLCSSQDVRTWLTCIRWSAWCGTYDFLEPLCLLLIQPELNTDTQFTWKHLQFFKCFKQYVTLVLPVSITDRISPLLHWMPLDRGFLVIHIIQGRIVRRHII